MNVGDHIPARGCVTLKKFLIGCLREEVEKRIGYHWGRLAQGYYVGSLLPGQAVQSNDLQLLGYSQVAEHRQQLQYGNGMSGLDRKRLIGIVLSSWQAEGLESVIKVFPAVRHNPTMDDEEQYPPGMGVPQWKLLREYTFRIVTFIPPGERLLL